MSEYCIQFAPTLDRPPETMVGETVYDSEGNAIGWVANAPAEPDEATMLKLHDRMNAALLDYESAMGIEGGNGANTVPFVVEMHTLLEEAATMGARGTCKDLGGVSADDEVVFNCSECGCVLSVFDKDGINNLCMSFIDDYPRFCPECGRRIIEEEK